MQERITMYKNNSNERMAYGLTNSSQKELDLWQPSRIWSLVPIITACKFWRSWTLLISAENAKRIINYSMYNLCILCTSIKWLHPSSHSSSQRCPSELAIKCGLPKKPIMQFYKYESQFVLENSTYKLHNDRSITDRTIHNNTEDIVIFNKTIKEGHLTHVAIPNSHNLHSTITEMLPKYRDLK
jgi:hypothetical protein